MHGVVATETEADSVLSCALSGFDTNMPGVSVYWYYNDQLIPETFEKYEVRQVTSVAGVSTTMTVKGSGVYFRLFFLIINL